MCSSKRRGIGLKALQIKYDQGFAEIQFTTVHNTINHTLVHELLEVFRSLHSRRSNRGVIFYGRGDRFFSPGFNLDIVSGLNRDQMTLFMRAFCELYSEMIGFTKPLVAVLNGDALAGGCILSAACSSRLAHSKVSIGFTEFTSIVGIPDGALGIFSDLIGSERAGNLVNKGISMRAVEAAGSRLIDKIVPKGELMSAAKAQLEQLNDIYEPRIDLAEKIKRSDQAGLESFMDRWFSVRGQNGLSEIRRKLGAER